jgi:hypothetical protein
VVCSSCRRLRCCKMYSRCCCCSTGQLRCTMWRRDGRLTARRTRLGALQQRQHGWGGNHPCERSGKTAAACACNGRTGVMARQQPTLTPAAAGPALTGASGWAGA